jgi:pyruvate dehydrogenase (quinone)
MTVERAPLAARNTLSCRAPSRGQTMAKTVADFIVDRLHQWGVRRLYGFPGDGINGFFGALQRAKGKIEFVQVRHEEMAAFMASAHAKFTGELGVCTATSGPVRLTW